MTVLQQKFNLKGFIFAAIGALAFAGKAIIVKLSYEYDVDAFQVLFYRMLMALPLFIFLALWSGLRKPILTSRQWLLISSLGFTGYYLASLLDFMGLQYTSASLERLILYLNPSVLLVMRSLLLGQQTSYKQWLALGLSYFGIFIVFGAELQLQGPQTIWGSILIFSATVSYAYYLLYAGELIKEIGALRVVSLATTFACLLCILQLFIFSGMEALSVPVSVLELAAINALLCTFLPVILVGKGIEMLGAGLTAQIGMIGPLATIVLGTFFLDETLHLSLCIGTIFVLLGIYFSVRK